MMDYFNRYRARKQEEPQAIELDENGRAKYTPEFITELAEDDAAHANWEGDWYMPTYEDFEELLANTTSEWMTFAGVSGYKFTSKVEGYTDKFIFLPAAGSRGGSSLYRQGTYGSYWSASVNPSASYHAHYLCFNSGGAGTDGTSRCSGHSVRAVLRK